MKLERKPTGKRCAQCVLPDTFPDIVFDADNICNYCRSADSIEVQTELRLAAKQNFVELCGKLQEFTKDGPYDCIVALSGGKDSTYTLLQMVEFYKMRCLAITIDNGFLSPAVAPNIQTICDALNVDHMQFRPPFPFMRRMYKGSLDGSLQNKAAIRRASAVCNSCINLINTHVVNAAIRYGIPLVAGGYLSGQLPRGRAVIEFDPSMISHVRRHQLIKTQNVLGNDAAKYFTVNAGESSKKTKKIYVANPLAAIEYNIDEIVRVISDYGWVKPKDTGTNSSNCMLNDFGIREHFTRHRFHPYEAEIAEQVRNGHMTREVALRNIEAIPTQDEIRPIEEKLGIVSPKRGH